VAECVGHRGLFAVNRLIQSVVGHLEVGGTV